MLFESQIISSSVSNILALCITFYVALSAKYFDAVEYFEEQLELYSIASRFIYEQAAPRINTTAVVLTLIQISSICIILFSLASKIISSVSNRNKCLKIRRGSKIEIVELIRVAREKIRKPPEQHIVAMNSIAPVKDTSAVIKEVESINDFILKQLQNTNNPDEAKIVYKDLLRYGEKTRLFYESQLKNEQNNQLQTQKLEIIPIVYPTIDVIKSDEPKSLSYSEKARIHYQKDGQYELYGGSPNS